MGALQRQLSVAACTLITAGSVPGANAAENPWEADLSYLSYQEADDRVSVSKTLLNLQRETDTGSLTLNLVHDSMSGASPTGALRGAESADTVTRVSGESGQGYSRSAFTDTRIQAGLQLERLITSSITLSAGGAISDESDYESQSIDLGIAKESTDKLTTFSAALAWTNDTIYRSDTGVTPEPLGNVQQTRLYSEGERETVDALLGISRVVNRQTVAQLNLAISASDGYHSDPYKIISAAEENGRIMANFHDSRPNSRLRTSLFGKLVHQLADTENSIHLSYRFYRDDWGVQSNTVDVRYRHQLTDRQYLEPHFRWYRQNEADFYQTYLPVDSGSNPQLPENGLASADYRLDAMQSTTVGMKYGIYLTPRVELKIRGEYLDQSFSTAGYGGNSAVIVQTSINVDF
ncbi:DUF3570 domain-containing protein [Granulosicoccus antarcticus]|uniref:DUF3570 domain-containing protein n=1 Tax=Granulosicoccus antarcticus IMCC3135 TaxID=1192854 RepID=A0A2Z2NML0_9GAMM|nr:DUF3570 domain-containing protein [Granulosicoccus antarcticus]ASJ71191.1 hypothetical protein IMCC3135_05395 [Granulosicoccus antarcticus IMCC3135]